MFENSAVWSAYGLATSDISRIFSRHRYLRMPVDCNVINETFRGLEKKAIDEMGRIGFRPKEIKLRREISMKFGRQVNVETIPVPSKIFTKADVDKIGNSFVEYYKSLYGEGAAFVEAGMEILEFIVHAIKPSIAVAVPKQKLGTKDSSRALKGKRDVFSLEKGEFAPTNIYEFERMKPGNVVVGPAIIESPTTTMNILSGQIGRMDGYRNLKVTEA